MKSRPITASEFNAHIAGQKAVDKLRFGKFHPKAEEVRREAIQAYQQQALPKQQAK